MKKQKGNHVSIWHKDTKGKFVHIVVAWSHVKGKAKINRYVDGTELLPGDDTVTVDSIVQGPTGPGGVTGAQGEIGDVGPKNLKRRFTMPESKTSTDIFIEPDEEALVSVGIHEFASKENPDGDNVFDAKNVSISIDNPAVHLDISLPTETARLLMEKIRLVFVSLANKDIEGQKQAEEETPAQAG